MREINSFAGILILLCTANFLATFAHQDSEMLRSKHDSDHARKLAAAEEIALTGKGQKGKGAYGGANVVHRQPGAKSATVSYRPCFITLSAAILGFSFI